MTRRNLILLPGLLNDGRVWTHQVAHLRGLADVTTANIGRADTVAELASQVLTAAPAGALAVAGLSMGGYVALEMLRQAPQRISGLALIGSSARPDTAEGRQGRHKQIEQAERDFEGVLHALLPKMVHPVHVNDPARGGLFLRMAREMGVEVFKRQQHANIQRPDSRPSLAGITCPTLVLHGAQDAIMSSEMQDELAAGITGARHVVIEHCGHLAPLEQPAAVTNALKQWLESIQD